jgi:hypothetical protein
MWTDASLMAELRHDSATSSTEHASETAAPARMTWSWFQRNAGRPIGPRTFIHAFVGDVPLVETATTPSCENSRQRPVPRARRAPFPPWHAAAARVTSVSECEVVGQEAAPHDLEALADPVGVAATG